MSRKKNTAKSAIRPGRFITMEGGDGAGKSTHANWVAEQLRGFGANLVCTREPGGTDLGEQIRNWVLSGHQEQIAPTSELMLLFAARAQHLHERIRPALAAGQWVLCERFTDATYAYQGGGRGLSTKHIGELEAMLLPPTPVDLTILFDLPPEIALRRKLGNRSEDPAPQLGLFEDRFEKEVLTFHQRVREAYRARAKAYPDRFEIIEMKKKTNANQVRVCLQEILNRYCTQWLDG